MRHVAQTLQVRFGLAGLGSFAFFAMVTPPARSPRQREEWRPAPPAHVKGAHVLSEEAQLGERSRRRHRLRF